VNDNITDEMWKERETYFIEKALSKGIDVSALFKEDITSEHRCELVEAVLDGMCVEHLLKTSLLGTRIAISQWYSLQYSLGRTMG
jgi:hypothetical protein